MRSNAAVRSVLPSVDEILRDGSLSPLLAQYGRTAVRDAVRSVLNAHRESGAVLLSKQRPDEWAHVCSQELKLTLKPLLKPGVRARWPGCLKTIAGMTVKMRQQAMAELFELNQQAMGISLVSYDANETTLAVFEFESLV